MRKIVFFLLNAKHSGTNCGVYCWYNYNPHWDIRRDEKFNVTAVLLLYLNGKCSG